MTRKEFYSQGLAVLVLIAVVAMATTYAHAGETTDPAIAHEETTQIVGFFMLIGLLAVLTIVAQILFGGGHETSAEIQRDLDRARAEELRNQRNARREREEDR